MKPYAEKFYKSKAWQDVRSNYFKYRGGLCECCVQNSKYVPGEIVHHKIHITPTNINNPEITLNYNNLELLCRECHSNRHTGSVQRRYSIEPDGSISPL